MTQLVCQQCEQVIEFISSEKSSIIYGHCTSCSHGNRDTEDESKET
ncbi:GapA-binding peptide SR1P [Robertmurraya korlensis]|nr:GapA-binding peptide SR1P [Robertmurraya korlensis]